jgi:hypothetical protein
MASRLFSGACFTMWPSAKADAPHAQASRRRIPVSGRCPGIAVVGTRPADVYQLLPYVVSPGFAAPAQLVIANPGEQATPISVGQGTVCADIYVFDANQEMLECCQCPITANGAIMLRVLREPEQRPDVTGNPLTGVAPFFGLIKIVSDSGTNCDARNPVPTPDLRAWGLFLPDYSMTQFAAASLQPAEQQFLGNACSFVVYLGSGRGVCTCGTPPQA